MEVNHAFGARRTCKSILERATGFTFGASSPSVVRSLEDPLVRFFDFGCVSKFWTPYCEREGTLRIT